MQLINHKISPEAVLNLSLQIRGEHTFTMFVAFFWTCLYLFIFLYLKLGKMNPLFDHYGIACNTSKSVLLLSVLCSYTGKHSKWIHNPSSFSIFHSPSVTRRERVVRRHPTVVSLILSTQFKSHLIFFFYYHEMKFDVKIHLIHVIHVFDEDNCQQ